MNLFYQPLIDQGTHYLDEEESKHCVKVLRRREGDALRVTDGKGAFYDAIITTADVRKCVFSVRHKEDVPPPPFEIAIAVAPTKNSDRIEWFVEKAVEIGIQRITLVDCQHSERRHINMDRLNRVAITAMKQSLKARLPRMEGLVPLKRYLNEPHTGERFIAVVDSSNPVHLFHHAPRGESVAVLVGPEGDFAEEEVDMAVARGFVKTSLGPSRLRTETAALVACHILNLINEPA